MDWLIQNWQLALPLALFVGVTVLNAVLKHYGSTNPGLARAIRLVLDILSGLTARNSPGTVKLPGTLSKPPVDGGSAGGPGGAVSIILLCSVVLGGCGATWHDVTSKALDASNSTVRVAHNKFIDATVKVCVSLAKECQALKDQDTCEKFGECRSSLRRVSDKVIEVHEMVAVARQLVIDARETTDEVRKNGIMQSASALAVRIATRTAEVLAIIKDLKK